MKADLFLIGLATIPFDNLSFAPTRGWATISPIIFFVYCFFNLHLLVKVITRNRCISLVYMSGAITYQLFLVIIYGMNVVSFLDGLRGVVLGIIFYFALIIRYEICHGDFNKDAKVLYKAYLLSFSYGILRLIAQKYFPSSMELFKLMEKRYYSRLAYTFTEPSFITNHTIGVMLLFTYFLRDSKLTFKFVRLSFAFMIVSILTASSARCAIDFIILMLFLFIKNLSHSKTTHIYQKYEYIKKHSGKVKSKIRKLAINVFIIFLVVAVIALSSRVDRIMSEGSNSDGSAATRWFKINTSLQGYMNSGIIATLAGWGMGNLTIPVKFGAKEALKGFTSTYTREVDELIHASEVDFIACFPIKLITEWGLFLSMIMLVYMLFKCMKKKIDIYVFIMIGWSYVQFDSYCFYSLWLLLYLVNYYDPKRHGISFFDIIS